MNQSIKQELSAMFATEEAATGKPIQAEKKVALSYSSADNGEAKWTIRVGNAHLLAVDPDETSSTAPFADGVVGIWRADEESYTPVNAKELSIALKKLASALDKL